VYAAVAPKKEHSIRGERMKAIISATTKINRKDFGLTWNAALETGGILVGDHVTITLEAEFVKA
jgi:polyisoprenoid-binding protein YceI